MKKIHANRTSLPGVLALLVVALLTACGTLPKDRLQQETLDSFRATIRFSEFDGIQSYIDSDYLQEHPITRLEINRLKQFRVSNYTVRSIVADEDGKAFVQLVELRLYNLRTASERQVLYRQDWVWHEDIQSWRLHSGLPDVRRY